MTQLNLIQYSWNCSAIKLFLKFGIINIHYTNIKKKTNNKKMGSPCLFTRRKALKLGYFYCLRVINSNHLHTELSLCYLKHTKFYPENKAYFIQISSIASFKPFLLAWLWGCCTFSDSYKYTNTELFSPKNHVLLSNLFVYYMFFSRMFLANSWKKKNK